MFALEDDITADTVATAVTDTEVLIVIKEDFLAATENTKEDQSVAG